MTIMGITFDPRMLGYALTVILSWGLYNRLRGWGGLPGYPFFNSKIISRYTMAVASGLTLTWYLWETNMWDTDALIAACFVTIISWWIGVVISIGEYQDGLKNVAPEVEWIDDLVIKFELAMTVARKMPETIVKGSVWTRFKHFMRHTLTRKFLRALPDSLIEPRATDAIALGLRGVYRIPMFVALGIILKTWWMIIPILFFWQCGLIYYVLIKRSKDYVMWADWVDGSLWVTWIIIAITLTTYTGY